jgi:hypothetical protein
MQYNAMQKLHCHALTFIVAMLEWAARTPETQTMPVRKKKTTKKGRGGTQDDASSRSTSFSTRFDAEQRELVEAAAKKLNWKPAKLIREASVARAVDIVNASDSADRRRLRELVEVVLRQLIDPTCSVGWFYPEDPDQPVAMRTYSYRNQPANDERFQADNPHDRWSISYCSVERPLEVDLMQVREAFRTCGTEFVRMLLDDWRSFETGGRGYKPKLDPGRLLGGLGSDSSDASGDRED